MLDLRFKLLFTAAFISSTLICHAEDGTEPNNTILIETIDPDIEEMVEPKIVTRFFSAEMCQSIAKLKQLNIKNPGFNKILLKVEGFPKHKEILVEMKRPLGKTPDQFIKVASFQIQDDGSYLTEDNEKLNYILGTSRGFLPGERVAVRVRTQDNAVSKEITGTPNPVVQRDPKGDIALRAELLSTNPTVYVLELPTTKEGEEFELTSSALGAVTKSKIKYSASKPIHYSPVAKELDTGGHSTLKIKRSNGEVYQLRMPWGAALDPYLLGGKCYPYHS